MNVTCFQSEKKLLNVKFISSTIFVILRTGRDINPNLFKSSCKVLVSLVISLKTWIFFETFEKYSNIKFQGSPSSSRRGVQYGWTEGRTGGRAGTQTDRQTWEANGGISQFWKIAWFQKWASWFGFSLCGKDYVHYLRRGRNEENEEKFRENCIMKSWLFVPVSEPNVISVFKCRRSKQMRHDTGGVDWETILALWRVKLTKWK
jgi:hypothetical protein